MCVNFFSGWEQGEVANPFQFENNKERTESIPEDVKTVDSTVVPNSSTVAPRIVNDSTPQPGSEFNVSGTGGACVLVGPVTNTSATIPISGVPTSGLVTTKTPSHCSTPPEPVAQSVTNSNSASSSVQPASSNPVVVNAPINLTTTTNTSEASLLPPVPSPVVLTSESVETVVDSCPVNPSNPNCSNSSSAAVPPAKAKACAAKLQVCHTVSHVCWDFKFFCSCIYWYLVRGLWF